MSIVASVAPPLPGEHEAPTLDLHPHVEEPSLVATPRELDAERLPAHGVEGMHEREATGLLVERVRPDPSGPCAGSPGGRSSSGHRASGRSRSRGAAAPSRGRRRGRGRSSRAGCARRGRASDRPARARRTTRGRVARSGVADRGSASRRSQSATCPRRCPARRGRACGRCARGPRASRRTRRVGSQDAGDGATPPGATVGVVRGDGRQPVLRVRDVAERAVGGDDPGAGELDARRGTALAGVGAARSGECSTVAMSPSMMERMNVVIRVLLRLERYTGCGGRFL